MSLQCHGLWDNKEVEMPDFFKKLKKKVDKKKTGAEKMGSREQPPRRLRFLPLQASTTSLFCRLKKGESAESGGEYSENPYMSWIKSLHVHYLIFGSCHVEFITRKWLVFLNFF